MPMKNILFYDMHSSGHHMEYFRYLIDYSRSSSISSVYFAIPSEAIPVFEDENFDRPNFISVPKYSNSSQLKQTVEEGKWIIERIREYSIQKLFFLNIDPYQYLLGTASFRKLECQVHGILFSPPHRLFPGKGAKVREHIRQLIRRKRKHVQLKWATRNHNLKTIFILDDPEIEILQRQVQKVTFVTLPDPIDNSVNVTGSELSKSKNKEGKTLLAFGSIIPRKNLENIIQALGMVKGEDVTLLVAGKGKPEYVAELQELSRKLSAVSKVIIDARFVSDEEMEQMFAEADGIIMVYLNFYGSSGVLGRSAKYSKPVVVADEGLVGMLTKKYNLGFTVNRKPEDIAVGIQKMLNSQGLTNYNGNDYLKPKTVENFCRTIFTCFQISVSKA